MPNNQKINTEDPYFFSGQDVSQIPTVELDSQIIDDILKQLEEQEAMQKETSGQNRVASPVGEIWAIEPKSRSSDGEELKERNSLEKTNPTESHRKEQIKTGGGENFEEKFIQFLEPLKNAKFEYERLGQPKDEKRIVGAQAIETYLHWVEESGKLLKEDLSDGEKGRISVFIPKRIQKQLENEIAPAPSFSKELNEIDSSAPAGLSARQEESQSLSSGITKEEPLSASEKENVLRKRIHDLEERINKLDQNKPEYPEELQPLAAKKILVEEEIRNKADKDPANNNQEKLEQELLTQELINKRFFENKAPVVRPEKEERERLQKAHLAEEIEKDEPKLPENKEEVPPVSAGSFGETKEKNKPEQKETLVKENETGKIEDKEAEEEKEKIQTTETTQKQEQEEEEEEIVPVYSYEQLETANEMRTEFHKKLSSLSRSTWYQSPSMNCDLVNKQIIQAAIILSGKESIEIDMNDIQTARIFMFNNAPEKILKHPAFPYVESFYNYQSSQGCIGTNPEEVFLKQKNAGSDLKSPSKKSSDIKKGRFFIEQVSVKKPLPV